MKYALAQINIARMKEPLDHPVMAEFVANLDPMNAVAERSPGFLWRLIEDNNSATSLRIFDDDFLIVNMSVWKDTESLSAYVYNSPHREVFKRRAEWFDKMQEMHMALWYVPEGQWPTVGEATERLAYLRKHGDTPYAFGFRKQFTAEESLK